MQKQAAISFIEKAKKVHGDRYDYSRVQYINSKTKVTIICPDHGEFHQIPRSHSQGSGCRKCANAQRTKTTPVFVERAKEVHGDLYDYSKSLYSGALAKLTVTCKTHGDFTQVANDHLRGSGCPKCGDEQRQKPRSSTKTEEFIEKAKKVHGDRYDYSRDQYTKSTSKAIIVCPDHGEFVQTPYNHLRGRGCPKCANAQRSSTKTEFVERANKVHGDRYDYSRVQYINAMSKVTIICPDHGEFAQIPSAHLQGAGGCRKCANARISKNLSSTKTEFVEKAKKVHGDRYDYSRVQYINSKTKVAVICPDHGEFLQAPHNHLRGAGCPRCVVEHLSSTKTEFVDNAKEVHGDRYDYSRVQYTKSTSKVTIVCQEHGEFVQAAYTHLRGHGCPKCALEHLSSTKTEFVERAKVIHGDRYDYSKAEYAGSQVKVAIICPDHGEFVQAPYNHLRGAGCPKCVVEHRSSSKIEFVDNANKVHDNKYDYSLVDYKRSKAKVTIVCQEHGEFQQIPNNHLNGAGCPKCANVGPSNGELEVLEFIKSIYDGEVLSSERSLIAPKELDVVIPGKGIAIEFNGLYWHSEASGKDKNYHLDKTKACEAKGYQLIHIFENEWINKREIVESRLKAKLGLTERRIYARKCKIIEVDSSTAKKFMDENHIQGKCVSSINLALEFENEVVAVMTFGKSRYSKAYDWELLRFANKLNTTVVGGASKLFKHFTKNNPGSITSYSDKRWNNGKVYSAIGMKHIHTSPPCYWYFLSGDKIYHRSKFQKHKLSKLLDNFDPNLSESKNMILNGYNRIFDCGNAVFVYHD